MHHAGLSLLSERIAACLSAFACTIAGNIHMFRMALVILIVHTVAGFTVNADGFAGMLQCADIRIPCPFSCKALTTGIASGIRMLPAYRNITFTAAFTFVIYAVVHTTVQLCHSSPPSPGFFLVSCLVSRTLLPIIRQNHCQYTFHEDQKPPKPHLVQSRRLI